MNNIEVNMFYSNNDIFLVNIVDKLVAEKKDSIIWSIKKGDIERYNKKEDYLSTAVRKVDEQ